MKSHNVDVGIEGGAKSVSHAPPTLFWTPRTRRYPSVQQCASSMEPRTLLARTLGKKGGAPHSRYVRIIFPRLLLLFRSILPFLLLVFLLILFNTLTKSTLLIGTLGTLVTTGQRNAQRGTITSPIRNPPTTIFPHSIGGRHSFLYGVPLHRDEHGHTRTPVISCVSLPYVPGICPIYLSTYLSTYLPTYLSIYLAHTTKRPLRRAESSCAPRSIPRYTSHTARHGVLRRRGRSTEEVGPGRTGLSLPRIQRKGGDHPVDRVGRIVAILNGTRIVVAEGNLKKVFELSRDWNRKCIRVFT